MLRRSLACLAVALGAGCGTEPEPVPVPLGEPARPAAATLGWRESYPPKGPALRFEVERLRVTHRGWSADVSIENDTQVAWRIERKAVRRTFGLMLFADDDLEALEEAGLQGRLPPPRLAQRLAPEPPAVLQRGVRWRGTLSAPGKLPSGAYVRIVFGPLSATEEPPEGMERRVVWITDHAHRLSSR